MSLLPGTDRGGQAPALRAGIETGMSLLPGTDRGGQAPALRGASKPGCLSYPICNQKWTAFSRSVTIHYFT